MKENEFIPHPDAGQPSVWLMAGKKLAFPIMDMRVDPKSEESKTAYQKARELYGIDDNVEGKKIYNAPTKGVIPDPAEYPAFKYNPEWNLENWRKACEAAREVPRQQPIGAYLRGELSPEMQRIRDHLFEFYRPSKSIMDDPHALDVFWPEVHEVFEYKMDWEIQFRAGPLMRKATPEEIRRWNNRLLKFWLYIIFNLLALAAIFFLK